MFLVPGVLHVSLERYGAGRNVHASPLILRNVLRNRNSLHLIEFASGGERRPRLVMIRPVLASPRLFHSVYIMAPTLAHLKCERTDGERSDPLELFVRANDRSLP